MTACPNCGATFQEGDFAFEGRVARCSSCGTVTDFGAREPERPLETALARASLVHWDTLAKTVPMGSLPWTAKEHGIAWEGVLLSTASQRRRGRQALMLGAMLGGLATLFFLMLPLSAWVVGILPAAMAAMALDLVRTSLRLSRGRVQIDVSRDLVSVRHAYRPLAGVRASSRDVTGVEVLTPDARKRGMRQAIGYDLALRLGNGDLVPLGLELDVPAEAAFLRSEIATAIDQHKPGEGYR